MLKSNVYPVTVTNVSYGYDLFLWTPPPALEEDLGFADRSAAWVRIPPRLPLRGNDNSHCLENQMRTSIQNSI